MKRLSGSVRPTFLIVDIEGGEHELLQHADLSTVHTLLIELHADILGETKARTVVGLLAGAGFETEARSGKLVLLRRPRPTPPAECR